MKFLIGNWKMAPDTVVQVVSLAKATATIARTYKKSLSVIAAVPSIHISTIAKAAKNLHIAGQGVAPTTAIASTGLVGANMLKGAKVEYCIVGHSESRARGESNEIVRGQVDCLFEKKIIPILCVGEKERDAQGWYLSVIKDQLESAFVGVPKTALKRAIVAYEPVWAIGAHATREATPAECQEMIIFIRKIIADLYDEKVAASMNVLYGGSVSETNARSFVTDGGADGLLVGRASLEPKRFAKLAQNISK